MKIVFRAIGLIGLGALSACSARAPGPAAPVPDAGAPDLRAAATSDAAAYWNSASIYFLLTDRFYNGDPNNDLALGRARDGAMLRDFQGGDLAGVLLKLEEGYFEALGVDAIWMTPFQEQNRGATDEGTGRTYAYHGYWIQDWTAVDPVLGTADDLRAVVEAAHMRGIRVLMDAIINHTGPVTEEDPVWPADWVRQAPKCRFRDRTTTVDCTLVDNLPDILTDRNDPVELPAALLAKWEREGRLDQELAELDAFFERTGHPRAPRYYLMKWLTDWVREYGFDGYRVDTAKHFEEWVSAELKLEAEQAFAAWRAAHPDRVTGDLPFFMMGEVYNYDMRNGRDFDLGDGDTADFFDYGYDGLINFDFKQKTGESLDGLFTRYAAALREGDLRGLSIVNYISSHDDSAPWDPLREDPFGAGTRLLLAPGGAQIYYGDELARPLVVEGAAGDANLRSFMNWAVLERGAYGVELLEHWRKLGQFRKAHPAVGAGEHQRLRVDPYVFSRTLEVEGVTDRVIVAMDLDAGPKTIFVYGLFPDGAELVDAYSGETVAVAEGHVTLDTEFDLVLLAESR
ncbi:MAG: alpha-amylase [Gemmatimonadetes bacterium]|nr:alpha-amylase [Gemmatimonadota bacterium]